MHFERIRFIQTQIKFYAFVTEFRIGIESGYEIPKPSVCFAVDQRSTESMAIATDEDGPIKADVFEIFFRRERIGNARIFILFKKRLLADVREIEFLNVHGSDAGGIEPFVLHEMGRFSIYESDPENIETVRLHFDSAVQTIFEIVEDFAFVFEIGQLISRSITAIYDFLLGNVSAIEIETVKEFFQSRSHERSVPARIVFVEPFSSFLSVFQDMESRAIGIHQSEYVSESVRPHGNERHFRSGKRNVAHRFDDFVQKRIVREEQIGILHSEKTISEFPHRFRKI